MDYRKIAETIDLPSLPWTHEALGEERYCYIASTLGYFDPKAEAKDYRPSLDPTPYKDLIKQVTKKEK